jgi:hypothetical protein
MDLLRSCYGSQMRMYADRPDVLVDGQWYWCPVGAKPLPFFHTYGSRIWDPKGFDVPDHVGEIARTIPWTSGASNPRLKGDHFCGSAEVWQDGPLYSERGNLPVDSQGIPLCCGLPPPISDCLQTNLFADILISDGSACIEAD